MRFMLRLLPWMLALALASTAPGVRSEPFSVDHMLASERFGAVRLSPDERHILFERIGPYETADRFDLGFLGGWSASEVWIADRDGDGQARPFLEGDDRRGVILGSFSPSGRRILLHRLRGDRWESGVAELATGKVQWLGVGAEPPTKGETAHWRSEDELILVVRKDGDLPYEIGALARAMRNTEEGRRTTAAGGVAATAWRAGSLAEASAAGAPLLVLSLDLRTGARALVAEGPVADSALSPDGRWLALATRSRPLPVGAHRLLRPGGPAEALELEIVDLAAGGIWRPCNGCDIAAGLLAWSAQGRLLVWARGPSAEPDLGRLLALKPSDKSVATLELEGLRPDVGATRDTEFTTVRARLDGRDPDHPGAGGGEWARGLAPTVAGRRPQPDRLAPRRARRPAGAVGGGNDPRRGRRRLGDQQRGPGPPSGSVLVGRRRLQPYPLGLAAPAPQHPAAALLGSGSRRRRRDLAT